MTSAEVAKQRLHWCVAQRRNGGAWIEIGYEMIEITLFYSQKKLTVPGLPNRYRWSYA